MIKEMNDKILKKHLIDAVEELKNCKGINGHTYKFYITPVVEEGKAMQAKDEFMRLNVLNPKFIDGKKYETVGVVKIPKINITYPILSKTTDALMKVAPCKFHGPNPNEVGNLCIIAHNYRRKGVFFSDVENLVVGDIVEVQDLSQRTVKYEIYDIHTVMPDNVADTTQKTNGRKEVTLITCTDDSKQRIIVRCKEIK